MSRKKNCIAAINDAFLIKKENAKQKQLEHLEEISLKLPQVAEIERLMQKNMSEFMDFVFLKNNDREKFNEFKKRSLDLQQRRAEILHENGYPIDYLEIIYECPKCKDEGYIGLDMCECYKKQLGLEYLKQSNMAPIIQNISFANFKLDFYSKDEKMSNNMSQYDNMKTALGYCKKYVKEFENRFENLSFFGIPGCGKTFLSCAIGCELINRGFFVLYSSIQEMISVFEAEKFGKDSNLGDTDVYYECDMLILDDLGTEFQTSFSETVIYNVLNSRINQKKPFIISTNYSPHDLGDFYHQRLVARIVHETVNIVFPSSDVRLKLKKSKPSKNV